MKVEQKIENWIYGHIKRHDLVTDFDRIIIKFLSHYLPNFVGVMINFTILSFVYFWIYNKYGIERVMILLAIQMIMSIGSLRKALS